MKPYAPRNKRTAYLGENPKARKASKGAARQQARRLCRHRCLRCGAGAEWIE